MFKVMLKRKLRGLLIAALGMIQLWLCGAWAETLEVTAQGKVLKCMASLIGTAQIGQDHQ